MSLQALHQAHGASLAADGIPLHYGNLMEEYQAARHRAVLFDRSHQGCVQLFGKSRAELLNRMSTNQLADLAPDEGRATIFTTAHARIIDRIHVYNHADHLLLITEPGRGAWLTQFLTKNIFFGDDVRLQDITPATQMFGLQGITAHTILQALGMPANERLPYYSASIPFADATIHALKRKDLYSTYYWLLVPNDHAHAFYGHLLQIGEEHGLIPAGSLTYNTLRIIAGEPARPELNERYNPLELGLWDEVSFSKGCYTGQEIIARIESRNKLAKTMVALTMTQTVTAPADVTYDDKVIGRMTSSVTAPDGQQAGLAVLKRAYTSPETRVSVGGYPAIVQRVTSIK